MVDRSEIPAYLAAGVGILTAVLGALGVVTTLGWASSSGGSSGPGAGLAVLGVMALRYGWVRGPAAAVGWLTAGQFASPDDGS